jgi:mono/diheme cytochrome c family protein
MRSALLALAVLSVFSLPARAQADAPTRGQLLYETHCIACHTTQVHWRDAKTAADWASLRAEVRRWQATAQLGWSDDDITEVARHLNQRYYHFTQPAGVVSLAPHTPAAQR